jgi:hypothetical protein
MLNIDQKDMVCIIKKGNIFNFITDGQLYQAYDYGKPSKSQELINKGLAVASSILEGVQTVGYIFKGGFYDFPKKAIEEGRADHLHVDTDIVRYGFKNGEFVKNTFSNDRTMTDAEGYDAFVKPSVDALTAPVGFGFKPSSNTVVNFITNFGVKSTIKKALNKLTRPEEKKK